METTLNTQRILTDTSSAFALSRNIGVHIMTPIKYILRLEQFELLDEWEGYVRFSFENFLAIEQPEVKRSFILPKQLTNSSYFHEELNQKLQELATAAPTIEQVWQITERLPSLSKLLSEERENE
jgi:hypothetical protein